VAAVAVLGLLASLAGATPAMANLRAALQRFSTCPYNTAGVSKCVYSETTSGEFVIGKGKVPVVNPVIIRGGIEGNGGLVPATDGNTLSKSPQPVPGGLVGIELLGNFTEVTATAELVNSEQAILAGNIFLPLKTKLDNPLGLLGNNCYIGNDSEPLNIHLAFSPSLVITFKYHEILVATGTLEGHEFSAPGATGCTLLPPVGDLAVNVKEGLPSPSGNSAVMNGVTEQVSRRIVKAVLPLPDFGHCVKLPGTAEGKTLHFNGAYDDAKCTSLSLPIEGKYEWVAGPGPKPKFTGKTGVVTLQTVSGKTNIKCTGGSDTGEYTAPKTESVVYTFTGCETGPKSQLAKCQSSGSAPGEIQSAPLVGSLDFIKESEEETGKSEVGLDLKPASGTNLLTFECGGAPVSVSGSVIAPITPVDTSSSVFKVAAKQGAGKQSVEAFEEGAKDTLTFTTASGEEAGGMTAGAADTNEEKLTVKGDAH